MDGATVGALSGLQQQQPPPQQQHPNGRLSFEAPHEPRLAADERLGPVGPSEANEHNYRLQGPAGPPAAQSAGELINWSLLMKYVNLNSVRNMLAQHAAELIVLCVIIIYLVYYFSRISKRPKLVGATSSKFVKLMRDNFRDPLELRFSPLIYFWGTNPQTALFGYLQGQTSDHEVPRNKFKRQYLFVSDAQYLASNVDLSAHYAEQNRRGRRRRTSCGELAGSGLFRLQTRPLPLDAGQLLASHAHQLAGEAPASPASSADGELHEPVAASRMSQNIQLATGGHLDSLSAGVAKEECEGAIGEPQGEEEELEKRRRRRLLNPLGSAESQSAAGLLKSLARTTSSDSSDSSAMGSSSDSGVFATSSGANSSVSSSSSHSGSSLTIDMESTDKPKQQQRQQQQRQRRPLANNTDQHGRQRSCSCAALYESQLEAFEVPATDSSDYSSGHSEEAAELELRRERLEFGQCALDWYMDSHKHFHQNRRVALISAGMTTGSDKKYVTDTVQTLDKLGYEVCVFIRRGVGGLKLSSAKFFSPSKWRDFEAAIVSIKRQRPDARLVAIGFSFGSIELCRYLSMSGAQSLVDSALLISCPFDPEAGGRNMRKRALNRKIDAYLAKNLGKQLHQALAEGSANLNEPVATTKGDGEQTMSPPPAANKPAGANSIHIINYNGSACDLSSLPKIKSLVDFEDNYNRVIQNYPSSDAYADDSRLCDLLANIKTPTLCLSSEDDFMAPMKLLPIRQIEANENLCMILTKRGGHMAFIDGILWPKRPYFAQRIIEKYMRLDTMEAASGAAVNIDNNDLLASATGTTLMTTTTSTTTTTTTTTLGAGTPPEGLQTPSPPGYAGGGLMSRPALIKSLSLGRESSAAAAGAGLESRFHLHRLQHHRQHHPRQQQLLLLQEQHQHHLQHHHQTHHQQLHLQRQQQLQQQNRHHHRHLQQQHRRHRYYSGAAYCDDS